MQVASILSDLTSLRVCVCMLHRKKDSPLLNHTPKLNDLPQDHSAALALVSVYRSDRASVVRADEKAGEDPDMQRAIDLVDLHYGVKVKHAQGEDAALRQARREVDTVLEKLAGHGPDTKGSGG